MTLPLEEYRKLMGSLVEKLSDEELSELFKQHSRIVDAMFDWSLNRRAKEPEAEVAEQAKRE